MKKLTTFAFLFIFLTIFTISSVLGEKLSTYTTASEEVPSITWQKSLGGSNNEYAYDIITMKNGGYIVLGSSDSNDGDVSGNHGGGDYWVVKLDGGGNIVWQKSMGGSARDEAHDIGLTMDGGGYTRRNFTIK